MWIVELRRQAYDELTLVPTKPSQRTMDTNNDEIRVLLRKSGAETASIDRLGRVAVEMCELEWKLARRAAAHPEAAAKAEP